MCGGGGHNVLHLGVQLTEVVTLAGLVDLGHGCVYECVCISTINLGRLLGKKMYLSEGEAKVCPSIGLVASSRVSMGA